MIDLRKPFNEPRSAHEQLGGVKLLARIIDKGRAAITGTLGPYYFFDCRLDRVFFEAVNVSRDEFLEVLRQAYISRLSHNAEALADLREAMACEPEIANDTFLAAAQASDVDNAAVCWLLDHKNTPRSVLAEINAAVDGLPPEAFIDRVFPYTYTKEEANIMSALPNIVLVHGAWADGSSWSGVIEGLQAKGYNVTAPQFALGPIANDVGRLRNVLARQNGPTVLAGHSYGGQIMTALGNDAPNVIALVYVAGFALDQGESIGALLSGPPPPAIAHIDVDKQGFAWLPQDDFVHHFAADVDPVKAKVMFAVQQPLAFSAYSEVMGAPAWKSIPSWFLIAQGDETIPPDAQRLFAKRMGAKAVEIASSHVAMVSHPKDAMNIIETAAAAVPVAT